MRRRIINFGRLFYCRLFRISFSNQFYSPQCETFYYLVTHERVSIKFRRLYGSDAGSIKSSDHDTAPFYLSWQLVYLKGEIVSTNRRWTLFFYRQFSLCHNCISSSRYNYFSEVNSKHSKYPNSKLVGFKSKENYYHIRDSICANVCKR